MPHHVHLRRLGVKHYKCRVCGQDFGKQIRETAPWAKHADSSRHQTAVGGAPRVKRELTKVEADASDDPFTVERAGKRGLVQDNKSEPDADPFAITLRQVRAALSRAFATAPKDLHVAKFRELDSKAASLTLDTAFRVFAELNQAPEFGLRAFAGFMGELLFSDSSNDVDRKFLALQTVLNDPALLGRMRIVGAALGRIVEEKEPSAMFAHGLRKLELEFIFGVFEVIFREQRLPLDDRLLGWATLRGHPTIAAVRAALGRRLDLFERSLRIAVLSALPFDQFYALFGRNVDWFSERHWRVLVAALELGYVDFGLEALLSALEPTIRVEAGPPSLGPTNAAEHAAALAAVRAAAIDPTRAFGKPKNNMMNKWYEVALALLSESEASALERFSMPLFWLQDGPIRKKLHFVDLDRLPLHLQPLEIYR